MTRSQFSLSGGVVFLLGVVLGSLWCPSVVAQSESAARAKLHPGYRKLFFVSLSLRASNAQNEEDLLVALGELARAVDGILLCVPSYYEFPDAPSHPLVQRFVAACKLHGLDVYWGRFLWVTWDGYTKYAQQRDDVFNPAYYAAYLSRLHVEAQMLGAAGTIAYGEPHGDSIYKETWFKRTGFTPEERSRVEAAIAEALRYAPQTTLVYPASWSSTKHFGRALRPLGRQYLHHQTYTVANIDKLPGVMPDGGPVQLDWLGSWITLEPGDNPPGKRPLTVEEWCALDIKQAVAQYPELRHGGLWIYVDSAGGERARVMYALGAAARKAEH